MKKVKKIIGREKEGGPRRGLYLSDFVLRGVVRAYSYAEMGAVRIEKGN